MHSFLSQKRTSLCLRHLADYAAVILITVSALWGGATLCFSRGGGMSSGTGLILTMLRPSILYAAGAGFYDADCSDEEFPALEAFFKQKIHEIPPEAFPSQFSQALEVDPLYGCHVYLNVFMGVLFRLFGISNDTVHLACLILHAVSMVLLYFLFRTFLGTMPACLAILYLSWSPALLIMVPELRDYGKFPFFLAVLLLLAHILKRKHPPLRLFSLAAALGAVIGIGWGFREDLLVFAPIAAIVLLLISPCTEKAFLCRIAATGILLLTVLLVSYPVRQLGGTGPVRTLHTLLAGITETPEQVIWFGDADYDFGYLDYDEPVVAAVIAFGQRHEQCQISYWFDPEYVRSSRALFEKIVQTVPADFPARGVSMTAASFFISECNQAALKSDAILRHLGEHPWIHYAFYVHNAVNRLFNRLGLIAGMLILLLAGRRSLPRALVLFAVFLYFSAYPSLLAEFRHFFHLFFVPLLLAGVCFTMAQEDVRTLRHAQKAEERSSLYAAYFRRLALALSFFMVLFLSAALCLQGLRLYQSNRVKALAAAYESLQLTPLDWSTESDEKNTRLLLKQSFTERAGFSELAPGQTVPAFLAVKFKEENRFLRFSLLNTNSAFFKECHIRLQGTGIFYFPAFDFGGEEEARFTGIEIANEDLPLVEGIYEAENAGQLPLWISMGLSGQRETMRTWKSGLPDHWLHRLYLACCAIIDRSDERMMQRWQLFIRRFPEQTFYADRALRWAAQKENEGLTEQLWLLIGRYTRDRRAASAKWLHNQADAAFNRKDLHAAMALYQKVLEMAPYDLWNLVCIGEIHQQEGNTDAAKACFQEVLIKAPESPYTAGWLQDLFEESHEPDADAFWVRLSEMHPEAAVPWLYHGLTLKRAGEMDRAKEAFQRSHDNNPQWGMPLVHLGDLLLGNGDIVKGTEYLNQALTLQDTLAPEVAQAYSRAAQLFQEQGKLKEAVALFEKALETAPSDLVNLVRIGEIHQQEGNTDAAKACFQEVLTKVPETPYAALLLETLDEIHREPETDAFWVRLIEMHPEAAVPWLYHGLALKRAGEMDRAKEAFQRSHGNNPQWGLPLVHLGDLLLGNGDIVKGTEYLNHALTLQDTLAPEVAQAYSRAAQLFQEQGKLKEAVALSEKALEMAPYDLWNLVRIGEIHQQEGNTDAAKACFQEVLIKAPESPYTAGRLQALFTAERDAQAEAFWRYLAELHPEAQLPRDYLAKRGALYGAAE